jgi:nitroreductase
MAFNLVNSLMWRSALKTFKKVNPSSVNIEPVLESIRLSPSSFGIQPYQVHVISNQEMKTKLRAVSYDQQQVNSLIISSFDCILHGLLDYRLLPSSSLLCEK